MSSSKRKSESNINNLTFDVNSDSEIVTSRQVDLHSIVRLCVIVFEARRNAQSNVAIRTIKPSLLPDFFYVRLTSGFLIEQKTTHFLVGATFFVVGGM